jgi:hypothetical protein
MKCLWTATGFIGAPGATTAAGISAAGGVCLTSPVRTARAGSASSRTPFVTGLAACADAWGHQRCSWHVASCTFKRQRCDRRYARQNSPSVYAYACPTHEALPRLSIVELCAHSLLYVPLPSHSRHMYYLYPITTLQALPSLSSSNVKPDWVMSPSLRISATSLTMSAMTAS